MHLEDTLLSGAKKMKCALSEQHVSQLIMFLELLQKWNRVYNLTAIRDPLKMVAYHLLDSLSVAAYLPQGRVIDVGTGPGFPGIPLAIVFPERSFTLLDSLEKRTCFLHEAVTRLQLSNIEIVQSRVESYQPDELFDVVISRAFAEINDMLLLSKHLCAPSGQFLAMKGQDPGDALTDLPAGVVLEDVLPLTVPGVEGARHLVRLVKQ